MMVSIVVVLLGGLLVMVRGINMGIDFAGGSSIHVRFAQPTDAGTIRDALKSDEAGATIQDLGNTGREYLLRLPLAGEKVEVTTSSVTQALQEKFGAGNVEILRVESVGPRVGSELRQKAVLAVLFATIMMGVYIWVRFEWRFGVGAAVALLHDVLLTVIALSALNYEFDLTIIAALLTIVGFSVNDTVIVSDRIRENRRKDHRSSLATVINRSINETLSRTILTTGTALLVVVVLYILGGTVIHGFAFALTVGFIVGTYSSIYIASPIVLYFERPSRTARPQREPQRAASSGKRR
jgi:preprotein translocase subunit SecF